MSLKNGAAGILAKRIERLEARNSELETRIAVLEAAAAKKAARKPKAQDPDSVGPHLGKMDKP